MIIQVQKTQMKFQIKFKGGKKMRKRLKELYPNSSEEYIQKAVEHIKESEVLMGHSHKLAEITDEEIKMYYEQIVHGIL